MERGVRGEECSWTGVCTHEATKDASELAKSWQTKIHEHALLRLALLLDKGAVNCIKKQYISTGGKGCPWKGVFVERSVRGKKCSWKGVFVERGVHGNVWLWKGVFVERGVREEECSWKGCVHGKGCSWKGVLRGNGVFVERGVRGKGCSWKGVFVGWGVR